MESLETMQPIVDREAGDFSRTESDESEKWFVMRDLKRINSKLPAHRMLKNKGFEVFTPLKWHLINRAGKKIREEIPFIQDLLFVKSSRSKLDPVVENTPTLQYRFFKGGGYREPMIVSDTRMNIFINAVRSTDRPAYYSPEELTPEVCGRTVRIIGGPLNGYEGPLLKVKGSKVKRVIVELPMLLATCVEVNPEFIQLL